MTCDFYVWCLLLEWPRLCDDNCHALGSVDDLLKEETKRG